MKSNQKKIILGITGNIGGGKSTVSKIFEELGAFRINSDELARVYTGLNTPIRKELIEILGEEVLDLEGNFDRKKIAEKVFQDKPILEKLNGLIHPLVRRDFHKKADSIEKGLIVWEVPLLFETDAYKSCDFTLTVFSDDEIALKRVQNREEKLTERDYRRRSESQLSIKEKLKKSDFIIENNGNMEELTKKIHEIYTTICES
ncbi:MAG: dephospho-CoA kinase [Leptospiraceae bacterium]|nr:dephospho-CoA kinase [Leptospiraceae bacterium]MCK6382297.1 dephospho-CoA kinase [Leptospiraceae bacterium]NUM41198.1 dephospho-CoA kinase [Leptospiraceae bacterium]